MSFHSPDPAKCTLDDPIHVIAKILSNVMGSTAESEIGASYINGKEEIPIRTALEEMGHPQPPTLMRVYNTTAVGFANSTIKQKLSKAIDMRFYWIQDRTKQGQFVIYWRPGNQNLGDYHTKHHSPSHHRLMRPVYLHDTKSLVNTLVFTLLQGCVNQVNSTRAYARRHTQYTLRQNQETKEDRPNIL